MKWYPIIKGTVVVFLIGMAVTGHNVVGGAVITLLFWAACIPFGYFVARRKAAAPSPDAIPANPQQQHDDRGFV